MTDDERDAMQREVLDPKNRHPLCDENDALRARVERLEAHLAECILQLTVLDPRDYGSTNGVIKRAREAMKPCATPST